MDQCRSTELLQFVALAMEKGLISKGSVHILHDCNIMDLIGCPLGTIVYAYSDVFEREAVCALFCAVTHENSDVQLAITSSSPGHFHLRDFASRGIEQLGTLAGGGALTRCLSSIDRVTKENIVRSTAAEHAELFGYHQGTMALRHEEQARAAARFCALGQASGDDRCKQYRLMWELRRRLRVSESRAAARPPQPIGTVPQKRDSGDGDDEDSDSGNFASVFGIHIGAWRKGPAAVQAFCAKHRITHIVNASQRRVEIAGTEVMDVDVPDTYEAAESVALWFPEVATFIAKHAESGVLVLCYSGRSRSASLVLAYAMIELKMSLSHCYAALKEARPCINPNDGFQLKLMELELHLGRVDTNTFSFFARGCKRSNRALQANVASSSQEDGKRRKRGTEMAAAVRWAAPKRRCSSEDQLARRMLLHNASAWMAKNAVVA